MSAFVRGRSRSGYVRARRRSERLPECVAAPIVVALSVAAWALLWWLL